MKKKKSAVVEYIIFIVLVFLAFFIYAQRQKAELAAAIPSSQESPVQEIVKDGAESASVKTNPPLIVKKDILDKIVSLPDGPDVAQKVLEIYLSDMDYPIDMIKMSINPITLKSGLDLQVGGYFNFVTGEMSIEQSLLSERGHLAAIIRHELDHFDKGAQIAKSIGVEKFSTMFDPVLFNKAFWERAVLYSKTDGFNSGLYLNALQRSELMRQSDTTSPYAFYFYQSEDIRNPLEISAYGLSDHIYKTLGYVHTEKNSAILQVVAKFNAVDWQIYELTKNDPSLKNARILLFDYFYLRSVLALDKDLMALYSGERRSFIDAYSRKTKAMSTEIDEKNLNILESVLSLAKNGVTSADLKIAYELKYDFLKHYYETEPNTAEGQKALVLLNQTKRDYLKLAKTKNFGDMRLEKKMKEKLY